MENFTVKLNEVNQNWVNTNLDARDFKIENDSITIFYFNEIQKNDIEAAIALIQLTEDVLVFETEKYLKQFVVENRKKITNINGVAFSELYPMLEVTNKHASYYDVNTQGNKFLYAPFKVSKNA